VKLDQRNHQVREAENNISDSESLIR